MNTKKIELLIENFLWNARLITFLAVIFSLLSSLCLFIAGSMEVLHGIKGFFASLSHEPDYNKLVIHTIGAVDLYLIGIVLLIFSFGVYELFISKIDPAKINKEINILEITSLDGLKNKLLKVMVMVLIVYFFKTILSSDIQTPLEMLYLGAAILAVSACTFFIRRIEN